MAHEDSPLNEEARRVKHTAPNHEQHNGKARIVVPADPEKVAAWRASKGGKQYNTKQFNQNNWDNWYREKKDE